MTIPQDHDALLTRIQVASALTEAGFPVSAATLSTKATRGNGPPFVKFGPRVLYRWGVALAWAKSLLSDPMDNTSAPGFRPKGTKPARSGPPAVVATNP
jgi:hypothetical protein